MSISIRSANDRDIILLAQIIRDSFQDVAVRFNLTIENCPTHPSNCTQEWIVNAFKQGIRYFILEDSGIPCGCVALEHAKPEVCYLERLSVLPACRRRGHGERLVRHVFKEAARMGAEQVDIALIARHTELRLWYEKSGFVLKDVRAYPHLPFEVTFMTYELKPE